MASKRFILLIRLSSKM
uniref:Uncharacterized protein n=1 Tax=Anguilla anguilla TaxID=7936 RepID=A0A0E9SKF6_ANGAN